MSTASQKSQSRHRPCKQLRLQYHDEAIRLYYEERLSYGRIGKELGFSRSTIAEWISNFATDNPEIHAQMKKDKGPTPEDYAKLQAEVARLQKALKAEHMRAEFYDTMIDVAEEMFKISIRKKLAPNSKFASYKGPLRIYRERHL